MIFADEEKIITQGTLETVIAELTGASRDIFQKIEKVLGRAAAVELIQEYAEIVMIPEEDFERVMREKEEKVRRSQEMKCTKGKSQ